MTDSLDGMGWRMHEARKRAGLSQADLASISGLSQSAIGMLESGQRKVMSGPHVFAVADALRVSARWLATGDQPKPEDGDSGHPTFPEDVILLARHLSTVTPERRQAAMVLLGIKSALVEGERDPLVSLTKLSEDAGLYNDDFSRP